MNNQDELNFRRFEEIYPVYRDMGRKVRAEFQKAKEIDLFNTKEIQSLKDRIKELENLPQGLLQLEATLGHVQELEDTLGAIKNAKTYREVMQLIEDFNPPKD